MILRQVEIKTHSRKPPNLTAMIDKAGLFNIRIASHLCTGNCGANVRQQISHGRIDRSESANDAWIRGYERGVAQRISYDLVDVDRANSSRIGTGAGSGSSTNAGSRGREAGREELIGTTLGRLRKDVPGANGTLGQPVFLIIDEEKRSVLTIEQFRNRNRTTNLETRLMQNDISARGLAAYWIRRQVAIVEPVVSIEARGTIVVITTSVVLVAAPLSDELDLEGAFTRAFSAGIRSRHCDFADGVGSWPYISEKAIVGFQQVILNVDSVDSDVECALGQAVDG